jgi:hypothetical protein
LRQQGRIGHAGACADIGARLLLCRRRAHLLDQLGVLLAEVLLFERPSPFVN